MRHDEGQFLPSFFIFTIWEYLSSVDIGIPCAFDVRCKKFGFISSSPIFCRFISFLYEKEMNKIIYCRLRMLIIYIDNNCELNVEKL